MLIKRLAVFGARIRREEVEQRLAAGWSEHAGQLIPPGWSRSEDD